MNEKKREERALDGLIASSMRSADGQQIPEQLPEMTPAEEAALDFGTDFIQRLMNGDVDQKSEEQSFDDCPNWEDPGELALSAGGLEFALNRAKEVDEEELKRKEQEIIDRIRKKRQQDG